MRDELLYYYERELSFLRRMGAAFAQRYPKVAARLLIEPTKCEDPHVERMLEGFAFLSARVHLKLDDDFSEISEGILGAVYPQYTRPVPSMSIAELQLDPEKGKLANGARVPRGSLLLARPVGGVRCSFRTVYDTTAWPITVTAAQWTTPPALRPAVRATDAVAALRLELRPPAGMPLSAFPSLGALRVYLNGDGALPATLYELLCNSCVRVLLRDADGGAGARAVELPPSAIRAVGFGDDEHMLPVPGNGFAPYALLQEYFTFPEKFLFLDLDVFEAARAAGFRNGVEVVCLIAPFERGDRQQALESGVNAGTFRLGCTPVVNLFAQTSEPILLTQRRDEYTLVADARRRLTTDIFSVDEVAVVTPGSADVQRLEPLYGLRHESARDGRQHYWYARRRPAPGRDDGGTDIALSFVNQAVEPVRPRQDAVTARLTCFNGGLPSRLPFGDAAGDFDLQGGGPFRRIAALVKPTDVIAPPLGRPVLWRLISQLSLNHLSLTDGPEALRELLRLHNAAQSPTGERHIQGLLDVRAAPSYSRVASEYGLGFARGRRVEMEFDEEPFAGAGVYLFASVLERFLAMYASLNSFTQLAARSRQRRVPLREWAPRAGARVLA
jgi:type VI secretion system protein ImpG